MNNDKRSIKLLKGLVLLCVLWFIESKTAILDIEKNLLGFFYFIWCITKLERQEFSLRTGQLTLREIFARSLMINYKYTYLIAFEFRFCCHYYF